MSKLGIAIKPTISGNFHPVTINEGDWTRKIHDVRPALLHFPELQDDHSKIASLFFFDEKGCFIVLARTITDNDLENISGWIYVPHDMQISTKQLEGVIGVIRRIISVSVLPEKSKLEEIFGNRELPTIKNAPIYETSPRNGEFAKRRARGKSLAELLSGNRFLPVYAKYESILVENANGEIDGVTDISDICAAEQRLLDGARGRQSQAQRQPQPIPATRQAAQFPQARQQRPVANNNQTPNYNNHNNNNFNNPNHNNTNNNRDFNNTSRFPTQRPEGVARKPMVTVDPVPAETQTGQGFLKGKGFMIAASILGVICIAGIVLLIVFSSKSDSEASQTATSIMATDSTAFSPTVDSPEVKRANEYLDTHQNWTKSDMEQMPELAGLFDALNSFDFTAITGEWKQKLSGSQKFKSVAEHAEIAVNNNYPAKESRPGNVYDQKGESILIMEYINWIDKNCTLAVKPQSTPKVGDSNSNSGKKKSSRKKQSKSSEGTLYY